MRTLASTDPRAARAQAIASQTGAIKRLKAGVYAVRSQAGSGHYSVEVDGMGRCTCPDFTERQAPCKHLLATRYYLQAEHETETGTVTERVPITYGQAWSAYNAAQAGEIQLFDALLRDLVAGVEEPVQAMGRPRIPLRDAIFCAVQKVYSQLSSRRARGLFENAVSRRQLEHAPHFNISSKFLNRADATPILHALIARSALPLAGLEETFAIDSTGFRTNSFGAYCAGKYGAVKPHVYLKAHLCVGTRTHVVTSARVTDSEGKGTGDAPQFSGLLNATAESGFRVERITADKAYSSRENHEAATALGTEALIPFKENANGRAQASPAWKKAFHFFQLHREEFEARYHKRSNVESAIAAIKRKFGETLRSKNRVAQENELLCKILAYNITVLIHEMHENGISPSFLQPAGAGAR